MSLTLGQRLTRLRKQKGAQQTEVAAQVGITKGRLSQLENDYQRGPDINLGRSTLERLAGYYGVMVEYLLVDTPQEYMQAFVAKRGNRPELTTAGRRLRFILGEVLLRWGEEFSEERIAAELGTSVETLRAYQNDEVLLNDDYAIARLAGVTGVPAGFIVPSAAADGDDGMRRVLDLARSHGMTPVELELLVQGWLTARKIRRPPD